MEEEENSENDMPNQKVDKLDTMFNDIFNLDK